MQAFLDQLMKAALAAGIEAAEAYLVEKDSFSVLTNRGDLGDYQSNMTRGLGFRGLVNGRMGYAATEAFDEESIAQLIKGVLESARLCEDTDTEFLHQGGDSVPELNLYNPELDKVTAADKLAMVFKLDETCRALDSRVKNGYNAVETSKATVRIVNTYGMDRSYTENICVAQAEVNAEDEGFVSSSGYLAYDRDVNAIDISALAKEAVTRAVNGLHATSIPSGKYRIVLHHDALVSLLGVFSSVFSAESAQKGMSLLKGKLGETIAAPCVTITDDPLLPDGPNSRPFDAEGVASKAHVVVENGVFRTFLHNLKTAHKDGVETTGNAGKAGYSSSVHVKPSNFFFAKGEKTFDELLADVGDGLVITSVSGLHAGANPVSGDFSLLSKGYTFQGGKREKSVEQITVAGNFYELLKNIRAFADDLTFPGSAVGSPSADVGELSVSGN
ncbi:MAG: TldD/PmbA family protein [Clostridia bacterium]|nr:TldD/PmbA family protein [Clostridia bacterium]